jgi:hypothetical protein
MDDI